MNAAEFSKWVEQPSLLRDASVSELRDLVQRYPYCASAHLLLLKKYQIDQHPDFDARLALTAAYANDRKALYRLLYDGSKFVSVEETENVSEAQRVGTEIMLGNESGAFADYTPKNQVAEIETYEAMDFVKSGWAEGLRSMEIEKEIEGEKESNELLAVELEEQFALANAKAGGGAEINHDYDTLEEDNDEELMEENHDVELESTKALEDAIEETVAENDYREFATASAANAEVTHRFDGLDEENENELVDEHFDAELESNKALEDAFANAVADPNYEQLVANVKQNGTADSHELKEYANSMLTDKRSDDITVTTPVDDLRDETMREIPSPPLEDLNTGHAESPSPKDEMVPESTVELEAVNEFKPSNSLAELLYDEDETEDTVEQTEENERAVENVTSFRQGVETNADERNEVHATMQEVEEQALPASLDEHEINPQEITPTEAVATEPTPDLTPRQEINVPIAEEDIVGTKHRDIPIEAAAPYRDTESHAEPKENVSHQPVDTQGSRSFTEWLKLYQTLDARNKTQDVEPKSNSVVDSIQQVAAVKPKTETVDDHADTLYDREWQARKLEMESWTSGLPDELKVIDEFVSQHSSHQPVSKPETTVAELAQRSLETRDEFVTETMAKVYATQGKFKKAAEVAEKLMLKYPAKRLYFADLLDEYRKKITPQ